VRGEITREKEAVMTRRSVSSACLVAAALVLIAVPPAFAARGGISFSAAVVPMGDGDAGGGFGRPEYNDAFDAGWAARVEPYFDFTPMIRGQFGVAYNRWDGKTFNTLGGTPVAFGELKMTAYYVGVKVRFLPRSYVRPYVVADIGAAHLSSVDVSVAGGPREPYWESSTTVFADMGGGVEFVASPYISFFIDIRGQGTGEPDSASTTLNSNADGVGSLPISAGFNISF
jgi:hypothetical protein